MKLQIDEIDSPIGGVLIAADGPRLLALDYADCRDRMERGLAARFGAVSWARAPDPGGLSARARAYFDGDLGALRDVELEAGGTPFQRRVWAALRGIRAGCTASYGELAGAIGRPTAARAVGAANGANPVAIAIPCHRVVGANGALTGYAGGIDRKRWLLDHEAAR